MTLGERSPQQTRAVGFMAPVLLGSGVLLGSRTTVLRHLPSPTNHLLEGSPLQEGVIVEKDGSDYPSSEFFVFKIKFLYSHILKLIISLYFLCDKF